MDANLDLYLEFENYDPRDVYKPLLIRNTEHYNAEEKGEEENDVV